MRLRVWRVKAAEVPNGAHDLSRAVVAYLGFGTASSPQRDAAKLRGGFGEAQGTALDAAVKGLLKELNGLEIDWSTDTLTAAGRYARMTMHERHPELSDLALDALEWKFTFDRK